MLIKHVSFGTVKLWGPESYCLPFLCKWLHLWACCLTRPFCRYIRPMQQLDGILRGCHKVRFHAGWAMVGHGWWNTMSCMSVMLRFIGPETKARQLTQYFIYLTASRITIFKKEDSRELIGARGEYCSRKWKQRMSVTRFCVLVLMILHFCVSNAFFVPFQVGLDITS